MRCNPCNGRCASCASFDKVETGNPVTVKKPYWSIKFNLDCCRRCKKSDQRHSARGYCASCYQTIKKRKQLARTKTVALLQAIVDEPIAAIQKKPIDFDHLAKFGDQWWLGMLTEDALEGYMKHKEANA